MKEIADLRTTWQLLIEPEEGRKEFRIHLFRHLGDGTTQILTENGIIKADTQAFHHAYRWQHAVDPSFRVGADLLQAFVDGLGEAHGITQTRFMAHLKKCSFTHATGLWALWAWVKSRPWRRPRFRW